MKLFVFLLTVVVVWQSQAAVQFSKSALYDIYDFVGIDEVPLPHCDNGCYIFASTIGKGTNPITRLDLFANSLIISQDGGRTGTSIALLSQAFEQDTRKKPLIITGGSKVSVYNQNVEQDTFWSIVLYVVDAQVAESTDFAVYDSVNLNSGIAIPANVTTIMSAVPFTATAKGDKGVKNSVATRLTGFDNALDQYGDECPVAFQTSTTTNSFPGVELYVNGPIISLAFSAAERVQIGANTQFYNNVEFYQDGFITSAGWNGCRKQKSGGYQSFRSPNYVTSNAYMIMTNDDYFTVHLEAEMHTDEAHPLLVRDLTNWKDVNWYGSYEQGTALKELTIDKTYFCELKSREMEGDQGFLVRHYGKIFVDGVETTSKTTPKAPATTPSTSDASLYCRCDVDKYGMPMDWKSTDIWLDVVIVVDTSEALSEKALQEAATFIESLLGDDNADVLTTDQSAPFYTRVGVIAMGDGPQILYNLNMTKQDSMRDKISTTKGVKEIDLVSALAAAQEMLAQGLIGNAERASTRGVIHFITDSSLNHEKTLFADFKNAGGVIIVNNVLDVSETPKTELKSIASDGFFFTEVANYMINVEALCKANCYCPTNLEPYSGGSTDPALSAAGGCYSVWPVGVPYSKANQACADHQPGEQGGFIATVHSEDKGVFLHQLIYNATHREYFNWIGYTKGVDGVWTWEDESIDAYTNWAVDEPSSAAASSCAYVDQSSPSLSWGAGNCQIGFPYACEYTPCSAGNKC